ncbi:MAG: hypothetical protein EOM10_17875 [Opitutae bacterium]|nr:hypothetical protein [Opitutae bacterium]
MNLLLAILAVLKAGIPLPDWKDEAAVATWLGGTNTPLAKLISAIAGRLNVTGTITEADVLAAIEAECPQAWGDGKFLELLKQLLPLFLQILPLFLEPSPAPEPQPTPPPAVV